MLERIRRTVDPALASRLLDWFRFGIRLSFWPVLLLTLFALALALGAKQKEYVIAGPFQADTNLPEHSLFVHVPREGPARWWRQPMLGDIDEKPYQSILQLRINDREIGPPHRQPIDIRKGKTSGFSHWDSVVLFSLPPGVKNDPETIVTLHFGVRPRHWVTVTLAVFAALLGYFGYEHRLVSALARSRMALSHVERPIAVLSRVPYLVLFGLCCAAVIGSTVFVVFSLYALVTGWALPTTALIRWSPIAEWAARNEPYLGHALLMCAGLGAAVTWLANFNVQRRSLADDERRSRRFFLWFGFPIAACAFVLCMSAIWSGLVRPGDLHTASIGGLVPNSDAQGHVTFSYDQVRDGIWDPWALKRPLAAAFRSVLLFFGNYSISAMLLAQAVLFAAAACLATYSVIAWRGIWAGLGFFGLIYIYARIFVPTTLTEPLGLFWALLSIPFFIESFRYRSAAAALIAFAITLFALMTRMGSMFTVPALMIWLIWQFGHSVATKLRIGIVAIGVLLGVLGLNSLFLKTYGTASAEIGSNFSYVVCGLSMGTNWEGCPAKLAERGDPLPGDEAAAATKLYLLAWQNFQAHPTVFLQRLATNVGAFATEFPDVIWKGYGVLVEPPSWIPKELLAGITLAGLLYFVGRKATSLEVTFWMLLWLSIVVSSSVVYNDDGPRTLAASQPLIALFFALGMSSPALALGKAGSLRLSRLGSTGLIMVSVLLVCAPGLIHRLSPFAGAGLAPTKNEALIFGGRLITGFLVVDDGQPLPKEVPAIHLSDFAGDLELGNTEIYQGLIHPKTPPLPFGFIFAPRIENGVGSHQRFIVPPYVLERRDIAAWRLHLEPWRHSSTDTRDFWYYVSKAEPWSR